MLELLERTPQGPARKTPLLFVHGAWYAAWCWDEFFLPYFASQGYACYAPSLRGHGGSPGHQRLRWTRLRDYVDDIADTAAHLPAQPILIGHSMGGFVVQKYLEQHKAAAGRAGSRANHSATVRVVSRTGAPASIRSWAFLALPRATLAVGP